MTDEARPAGGTSDADILSSVDAATISQGDAGFIAALLLGRISALENEVKDLKPKKKDFFDKLSQLSALITGGAIAGVGTLATVYYNSNQDDLRRLEAMDKFRVYLTSEKSAEDRKFGYYALTRLGQENFAIDLITFKRDPAGADVLTDIAANSKDAATRKAANNGIVVLRSNAPGCRVSFTAEGGVVNFLDGWENTNIKEIVVPQLAKIPKGPAGGKLRFNVLAVDALRDAWAEVEQMGLLSVVASWDGAYSARVIRGGSNRLSAHACGLAFDINATANAIGQPPKPPGTPGSVADLVPIFEKHGFKWGGNFKPKPDAMHFEFVVPDAVSPAETASAN